MIAATILPLAAGNQEQAIALAGMLALLVGRDHRRRRPGQARLRRRPALEPGPDRLPRRARGRHLRRPAAQAVRVQHRRQRSGRRGGGLRPGPRPDEPLGARHRPAEPRRSSWASSACRRGRPASSSPSSSRSRCRSCSTLPRTAWTSSASCRRASRCPSIPHVAARRHPAAVRRGARDLARGDRRHDLDVRAGSPTRGGLRGGRQPGARRASARPTSPPACSRASRSARAARGRPSPFQSGAKTQLTGLVAAALVLADAPVRARASSRRCRSRSSRRWSSPRRSACSTSPSCAGCTTSAGPSSRSRWRARLGVAFVGVLQGIVIAVVLSVSYIFKRAWAPYSTVLGKVPGVPGYHDVRRYPDAEQVPGPDHRSLVGAAVLRQRQPVPRPDPELVEGGGPAAALGPRRRRADHRHRHHRRRRCSPTSTWSSTRRHPPRVRRAPVRRPRLDRAIRAHGDHRGGPLLPIPSPMPSRRCATRWAFPAERPSFGSA